MRLDEMTPLQKAYELEKCIAKAELDVEYAIQIQLNENEERDNFINNAKVKVENTKILFSTGKLEALDYDIREQTYADYMTILDSYLRRFPEYTMEKDIFKPKTF